VFAAQSERVDLDADLEEQQDDSDVRQHLQLTPVGDIPRGKGRHDEANRQVTKDGGQPDSASEPARSHGEQKNHPDLEHRGAVSRGTEVARTTLKS